MTIKQQINHGAIQNVCHLHNDNFSFHSPVSHFVNFTPLPTLCYSLTNYRIREKNNYCIYDCLSVSLYMKGGRKSHLQRQSHF